MRFACVLLLVSLDGALAAHAEVVVGRIVDSGGAPVGKATVRLVDQRTRATQAKVLSEADGNFRVAASPGAYVIAASAPGFQETFTASVVVQEMAQLEVGDIKLAVAGCDSPGTICDYVSVGSTPPETHPHSVQGHLDLVMGCAGEVLKGRTRCMVVLDAPPETVPPRDRTMHVWFVQTDDKHVYLQGMNRTRLTKPNPLAVCRSAAYTESRVILDGLGSGSQFCLRTKDGHASHLFVRAPIEPGSTSLSLAYTTDW